MTVLSVNNLNKSFFSKRAVNNLNLQIEQGKIYGLLGVNGSGKTTLMRMISGLLKQSSGEIKVMDKTIGVESKEIVAFMPTDNYLYKFMKVKQLKQYYLDMYKDFDPDKFDELIESMGISQEEKVSGLSTGMTGRVKLSLTMARKAKLFLLDEPLNGIDPISREKIVECIVKESSDENTIILSSHLISEMEQILDDVIFIKDGAVELVGNVEKLRTEKNKSIEEMFKEVLGKC